MVGTAWSNVVLTREVEPLISREELKVFALFKLWQEDVVAGVRGVPATEEALGREEKARVRQRIEGGEVVLGYR